DRFGVPLPEEVGEPARRREPLTAANAAAAAFFRAELRAPGGGRARAYLRERGLSEEVIERFGLGWAPGAGEALARHLRARGVPVEDALTAGLLLRRDRPDGAGGVLDRFRDRIMFPITDTSDKVIAFGGRILPGRPAGGEAPPKYLNSAESPVFRKGHTLYGLALARDAIRKADRAIVVEGYLDVIALAQAGIGEVVAPLGTALTADQLRLLRRFSEGVIACFDGDLAGRRAAARSFPVFLEAGLWGRGAFLPTGEDPDTFVRTQGRAALEGILAAAEPLVEAFVGELAGPKGDAVGRHAEAAREVARLLKRVREPHEFDVLARLAAQRLGVREETLRGEGAPGVAPAAMPDEPHAPGAEATLVELMAEDATLAERVAACGIIAEFQHPEWRRTAEALARGEETERMAVVQSLPRGMRDRLARRLLSERPDAAAERDRALADCIAAIRRRGQRGEERRLRDEIRTAEARGDAAAAEASMRRLKLLMDEARAEKART
ncbi:MAG TPA: toprim domain-containing protein, partial [Verrucomicrobiae bacterium]|nr:toprim domain-containing protein [Verrucomicrobiae bacterium]